MNRTTSLGFLADFIYPMWLVAAPPDLTEELESGFGLRRSYWDVMFQRTTTDEITLTGRRQGFFSFQFPKDHPGHIADPHLEAKTGRPLPIEIFQSQILYANCFALCYHSAAQTIDQVDLEYFFVTPHDVFRVDDHDESDHPVSTGPLHRLAGHSYGSLPIGTASTDVLDAAFNLFSEITAQGQNIVELVALLNQAAYSLQNLDTHICLVLSWTVSEVLISQIWVNYIKNRNLEQTGTEPSKNMIDLLTGRDYTASVMTETLSLAGEISQGLRHNLTAVRKARNNWVHSMAHPSADTARDALDVARDMMERALGISIQLEKSGSARVWGGRRR